MPYRRLFEHNPQPMFMFDTRSLRFLAVNAAAIRQYGYSRREFNRLSILDIRPPEEIPALLRVLDVARSGKDVHATWRHRKKNGELFDAEVHWNTITVGGRSAHLVLALDITPRRRAEAGLRQFHEQLERRVAERTAELEAANRKLAAQMQEHVQLSNRIVQVQESERRRLARELHDQVGQTLTGLKLTLQAVVRLDPNEAKEKLAWAASLVDTLMRQIRELSLDLRPAVLDDLGLLPALLWHVDRYTEITSVRVVFTHVDIDERFPSEVETTVFRVVQEALTNIARHAGVSDARVWVRRTEHELCAIVEDDGPGIPPDRLVAPTSGVSGMRERAQLVGGRLLVESSAGAGSRITLIVPLESA